METSSSRASAAKRAVSTPGTSTLLRRSRAKTSFAGSWFQSATPGQ
jgi:hypothetical protein